MTRRLPTVRFALAFAAAPVFVAVALHFGPDPVAQEAAAPLIHREQGFVGSSQCKSCHPDHHASWRATFHSTMTQRPAAATVRGAFDGQTVSYAGNRARPYREGDRFLIELAAAGQPRRTAEVALLVGSRRYQQYFERERRGDSEAFVRLPILWHIEMQRWLPVVTVFLGPDDADWNATRATWNENCILCHNTGPMPRMTNLRDAERARTGSRFDSEVGELGIACEACHGPGRAHAEQRRDPLGRYALQFSHAADPTVVDPERLDQERAVSDCGQCHGARLPEPMQRFSAWLTTGPTFRAGDRLRDHVAPITAATPVQGNADPDLFRLRFWPEGTPRLTAYEYQGVTSSPCYRKGPMTCQSCHAMHAGDPKGQLRPDLPGNRLCTQCHEQIGRELGAHTHHALASSGSQCVECHMPRMVYGILDVHRSHRIESPDPRRDAQSARPHACTLCHADRTLLWSAAAMRRLWGGRYPDPERRLDGAPLDLADAEASLLAGDAVQRAVYAAALGRPHSVSEPEHEAELRAALLVTLGDGYPSVRWLAQRSLLALEQRHAAGIGDLLARVDHTAGEEQRRQDVFALLDAFARNARAHLPAPSRGLLGPDFRLDLPAVVKLTDLQGKNPISIGE